MIGVFKDLIYVTGTSKEFVNHETGESRVRCKATFCQRGQEPMVVTVSPDLFEALEELKSYDLQVEIYRYEGQFFLKAFDFAQF